ncbi:coproporphyrinogen dehydrogenase HemZ [Anaerotalea alkaliphila]|uniref:Coproporphyrinogen dehydrogenase HemZ n=1 Tax=Anaerotalea alkaliphila TaxID=2662126 RepID=A0A7X5HVV4_9FIRM|nr:coproporphyrinogen dehydrogenase HemZ [Anaerotalea alkaliphila]NDL67600.1 coproporphyrinogen dehydrogenase HemZ [Anaerotalea alkaliphila]
MKIWISEPAYAYDAKTLLHALYKGQEILVDMVKESSDWSIDCRDDFLLVESPWGSREVRWNEEGSCFYRSFSGDRKKREKFAFKHLVYNLYLEGGGAPLPWGVLTGIRPTKIVLEHLREGSLDTLGEVLARNYRISPEKIRLLEEIAAAEQEVLQGGEPEDMSVYVGIPFCPTRCLYCSFTAYPMAKNRHLARPYVDALVREVGETRELWSGKAGKRIRSLYIGGGTPTALDEEDLEHLLEKLSALLPWEGLEEITVEAGRPDTITREKLEILRKYGIHRISINPQTMNQKTLDRIGREHTVRDVEETFRMAREMGFDRINMDLILGLSGEGLEEVRHTFREVEKLAPDNLTVHTLAVKRASRLKEEEDLQEFPGEDKVAAMVEIAREAAREMGLAPYYMYRQKNMVGSHENIGYARPGTACVYNVVVMEEVQTVLAYGAGAITKVVHPRENRIERIENVKNLEQYLERIQEMIDRKMEYFL